MPKIATFQTMERATRKPIAEIIAYAIGPQK